MSNMGDDLQERVQNLEKAQEVQAATAAGVDATQAAADAGMMATWVAGSAGFIAGMLLGVLLARS